MKRFALTTAIVLGLSAPAFANSQLALSLGVEPGAYTTSELVQLRVATENQDRAKIAFILSGGASESAEQRVVSIEAAADREEEEGDFRQAAFLRGQIEDGMVSMSTRNAFDAPNGADSVVSRAGIDTAGLSAAEVLVLSRALEEGDQSRVFGILSKTNR